MDSNQQNKFWLFCPTCGETVPEIYLSSDKNIDLIDIRCSCEINLQTCNYYDNTITLDPETYVKYCEDASKNVEQHGIDINKKGKIFCLHCKKWLNKFEKDLHNKIMFSYPHYLTNCNINIGSFCEEAQEYHPTLNIPSKFYCETHGKHICESCNNEYHLTNGFCVVQSLETMRRKVNDLYINLSKYVPIKTKHTMTNNNSKNEEKGSTKDHHITQKDIRDFFNKVINQEGMEKKQPIRDILYNLFRLYFHISESRYPNYRLAKSILNLNMKLNLRKDKLVQQISLSNKSINYYQVMNYFPKKIYKDLTEITNHNNIDYPFSSILIPLDGEHTNQFVFMSENNFKIGGICPLDEPKQETFSRHSSHSKKFMHTPTGVSGFASPRGFNEMQSPKTKLRQTFTQAFTNSSMSSFKNTIGSSFSSSGVDLVQEQAKSPIIEQENFNSKDEGITNCEQEENGGMSNNKDKVNNKKIIFEVNYKQISTNIKLLKFLKCPFDNRLAAFCSQKEGTKEHLFIKIFEPIVDDKNGKITGYKTNDKKDYFSKQMKSEFSDFTGMCEYIVQPKIINNLLKKENEWKFLCFGNHVLKITCEEGKKIQIEIKLKFKDVFKDNKDKIWLKFSHFMTILLEREDLSQEQKEAFPNFVSQSIHFIVENASESSTVHSLILANQNKPNISELFTSKSPLTQSICMLKPNTIAIGGITNDIEIFEFQLEKDSPISLVSKPVEVIKTHHHNGIHCIIALENWFISGGGNGSFIIWNKESLQMLNVIFDDEAMTFPVISVIQCHSSFGEYAFCCCYKGRGFGFWVSETDLEDKDGKRSIAE